MGVCLALSKLPTCNAFTPRLLLKQRAFLSGRDGRLAAAIGCCPPPSAPEPQGCDFVKKNTCFWVILGSCLVLQRDPCGWCGRYRPLLAACGDMLLILPQHHPTFLLLPFCIFPTALLMHGDPRAWVLGRWGLALGSQRAATCCLSSIMRRALFIVCWSRGIRISPRGPGILLCAALEQNVEARFGKPVNGKKPRRFGVRRKSGLFLNKSARMSCPKSSAAIWGMHKVAVGYSTSDPSGLR